MGRSGRYLIALFLIAALCPDASAAAGRPEVAGVWTTQVTATSAALHSEVDPEESSTHYHFEYLTRVAYDANLAAGREGFAGAKAVPSPLGIGVGAGAIPIPVSFTLIAPSNPLIPATSYSYRVVATSAEGTAASPTADFRTQSSSGSPGLPDGRAWEMVSPPDKGGGAIAAPGALFGGGDIQAASGGGALTYGSATAFAEPLGAPPVSQYLSRRSAAGWSTANLSPPSQAGGYGDHPDGAPFRVFSPELDRGLVLNGARCSIEGTCPPSYSLWERGALATLPTAPGLRLEGSTADLRHTVFAAEDGLYEWNGGGLERLSPLAGAALAAPLGAISADGSRVYLSVPEGGPLELYEAGVGTRALPQTTGGPTAFQAAAADGSLAYFIHAGALYRYVAAAGTSTAIASGVSGVLAVSADGAYVYYQDAEGLELWRQGSVRQIAAGAGATVASDYPPATATGRLGAAGSVLAFLSAAPLAGDDTDAGTGLPDTELYLYDSGDGTLICASCNPTGERPRASARIPGLEANGRVGLYRPRVLSADGRRVFFETADSLSSADVDARTDVYQWEAPGEGGCGEAPGCLDLISSGRGEGGRFLDASADGSDVFFLTGESLVDADPGSIDAYDARVGGGLAEPEAPIPCVGDACQALPSPPEDPGAGTAVPSSGNPAVRYEKQPRGKHHGHRRRHKRRHAHHRSGHKAKHHKAKKR